MYISKTVIAALAIVGAIVLGWVGHDVLGRMVSSIPAAAAAPVAAAPVPAAPVAGSDPARMDPQPPASAPSPVGINLPSAPQGGATTNFYLTIVTPSGSSNGPASAPMRAVVPGAPPAAAPVAVRAPAPAPPVAAERPTGRPTDRPNAASASARAPGRTTRTARRTPQGMGPAPRVNGGVSGVSYQVTPGMATSAIGDHIVIAQDGSIVYVGDHGILTANTGDANQGGTVALDSPGSSFSTRSSTQPVIVAGGGSQAYAGARAGTLNAGLTSTAYTMNGVPMVPGVLAGGSPGLVPVDMSPLASAFSLYTMNRTADIAGFEDHSVLTRGVGNVVTYDNSNVFMNRDGKINANTGDTDSAGLNAVAVVRSTVSAGPHCDDGCDDESIIQAKAGVFDEGDVAIDGNGNVVWSPDIVGVRPSGDVNCDDPAETNDDGCDDSAPGDNGDDSDAVDDESPDGDVSDPAEPAETREEADTTRAAAGTGTDPTGRAADGSLTVGGDGIDDLSERVDGVGNVSSYDDSNVVIGGSGAVNAQIGDSDTGGTVVMDIVDSTVSGGNSR